VLIANGQERELVRVRKGDGAKNQPIEQGERRRDEPDANGEDGRDDQRETRSVSNSAKSKLRIALKAREPSGRRRLGHARRVLPGTTPVKQILGRDR
jgi:hypothetical protein